MRLNRNWKSKLFVAMALGLGVHGSGVAHVEAATTYTDKITTSKVFENGDIVAPPTGVSGIDIDSQNISINNNGMITVSSTGEITVIGRGSSDINLGSGSILNGTDATVLRAYGTTKLVADNLLINFVNTTTTNNKGYGIWVSESATTDLTNSKIIGLSGGGIVANYTGKISLKNSQIEISGPYASYAVSSQTNSQISLEDVSIKYDRGAPSGRALFTNGSGMISAKNVAIDVGVNSSGASVHDSSQILFSGNTRITLADPSLGHALYVNGSGNITGTGIFDITGKLMAHDSGKIDLTMDRGSTLQGWTEMAETGGAVINFIMTDSQWDMTRNSNLTQLAVDNTNVNFATDLSDGGFGILTVQDLSGNGIFGMRTDLAGHAGDLIDVTGTSAGSHILKIENQGAAINSPSQDLTVVKTADGVASFALQNSVELGGFEYQLKQVDTNWDLYSKGLISIDPADPDAPLKPIDLDSPDAPRLTTTAAAAINSVRAAYLMNYAENQTLIQRMGDLRQDDSNNGAWAKVSGGTFSQSDTGSLYGYDMDYTFFQVGLDKKIHINPDKGNLYVGGMFGYAQGNMDYYKGSGSTDSKSVGAYATYIAPNGVYADLVLKYGRLSGDFSVLDTEGNQIHGKGDNSNGFSGSLEAGKRIHFDKKNKEGFYLEPQMQITAGHQGSGSYHASNGLQVDIDSYNSTLGRIGILAGYEVKHGNNPINMYAKASYVHEFSGNMGATLNGVAVEDGFKDSWLVYGLGVTAKVNQKHNLYLDVERASGGQFKQSWAINGGYRFNW